MGNITHNSLLTGHFDDEVCVALCGEGASYNELANIQAYLVVNTFDGDEGFYIDWFASWAQAQQNGTTVWAQINRCTLTTQLGAALRKHYSLQAGYIAHTCVLHA